MDEGACPVSAVRTCVWSGSVISTLLYLYVRSFRPWVAEQSSKSGSIRPSRPSEPEYEERGKMSEGKGSQPQATSHKRVDGGRFGGINQQQQQRQ